MTRLPLLCAAAFIAAPFALPASAQDAGSDRVNQVIIYGEDACPQPDGDTITVCARLPESERYRVPPSLRYSDSPSGDSWTARAESLEAVGRFGPLSCTPAGAGGELGCTMQMIAAAYEDKANGADVRFSQLIAEARAERTAGIDEEAAETQRRVEALERAAFEKQQRDGDAPLPPKSSTPVVVDPARIVPLGQLPPAAAPEEDETTSATPTGSVGQ